MARRPTCRAGVWEHKNHLTPGFTSRYGVAMPVFYEHYEQLKAARIREYAVKRWRRTWKLNLIEAMNPRWRDLYPELNGAPLATESPFPNGEADPGLSRDVQ